VQEYCAADDAQPISSFFSTLKSVMDDSSHVYVDLPEGASSSRRKSAFDLFGPAEKSKRILHYLAGKKSGKTEYDKLVENIESGKRRPLAPEVGKLRAVKSASEQAVMRAAAEISANAHAKVGQSARPGVMISELRWHVDDALR
jgi:intermediate cleaving peptidase 55